MFTRNLICAGLAAFALTGLTYAGSSEQTITQAKAEETALSRVKGGVIESAKLEREGKKLLWSIDVKMPGSKNISEVHLDAVTGRVLSVTIETPSQQAAEAAKDKAKDVATNKAKEK